MKIVLMRHYKVKMTFQSHYDSAGFTRDELQYNECDVYDQGKRQLTTDVLYASSMQRAQQTARLAFAKEATTLDGVHEVTFKSHKNTTKKLPLKWWNTMARLHWLFNCNSQYETRKQTVKRLNQALDSLEARGEDATVVMHGFTMRVMAILLKRRGYKGPLIIYAKNGMSYHYHK